MDPPTSFDSLNLVKGFKTVHLNVRSILKKIDQLRILLSDSNIDVFTVSETWLKKHLVSDLIEIKGYRAYRLDRESGKARGKRGGGLLTYINEKHGSSCEFQEELSVSNTNIEAQWTFIHRPHCKNVVICNAYRPPNGDLQKALTYLDDCLKTINLFKTDVFIVGDLNVNYKNKSSPAYKKIKFFAQSNSLTQYIESTTRNTDKTNTLLDLALSNSKFINQAGTLEHFISDHQPIYIVHKKSRDKREKAYFEGRSYRNFDKDLFKAKLSEIDWTEFYELTDPTDAWVFLHAAILGILDQMCPIKSFRIKNYRPDWLTKELIEQIKDRDYFYRKAKQKGDLDSWNIAKYLRNITNSNIRQAKRDYILEQLDSNEHNAKKFWKVIRKVVPSGKLPSNHEILLKNANQKLDRTEVAHYINNYFINVGNPPNSVNPSPPHRPHLNTSTQDPTTLRAQNHMGPGALREESCSLGKVSSKEVYNIVKSINISKSSGLDNISSFVLKEAFSYLVTEVTFMFNLSVEMFSFPDAWKKALVVPIPKQGNSTKVQNYRPISLLPLPGKILEKLVHGQLTSYLESESLLVDFQHGFRRGHSTVHSIAQFTDYVSKKIDTGQPTIAAFIDFRKAFDCVQHNVLLQKLRGLNLDEGLLAWVGSYLENREQRVYANSIYSSYQYIKQGVPQGSVLGPLFYIIYANDIAEVVGKCKIAMYADDTVLYMSHKNHEVAERAIKDDLNSLATWCERNSIMANTDKTKIMIFGSSRTLKNLPPCEIKFGADPLQVVSSYKYLGLTLDSQLNYNKHVNNIVNSVSGKLKQFQRMRNFLNIKAALLVYKCMLLPIIEYGDIFLNATSAVNRKKLQTLQNKGLRCALNKGFDTGSAELHTEANILKLKYRREQHLLNFMYDFAATPLNQKPLTKTIMVTRSQAKVLLKLKRPRTEKFKKSLGYVGPNKWNSLPAQFHHTTSKVAFKIMVENLMKMKAKSAEEVKA